MAAHHNYLESSLLKIRIPTTPPRCNGSEHPGVVSPGPLSVTSAGDAAIQSLLEPTVPGSEVDIITTGIRIPNQACNTSLSTRAKA